MEKRLMRERRAKVIADSIWYPTKSPLTHQGNRVTTLEIILPKVLLAEFNTHRVFTRNFSSSRAIPTKRVNDIESFYPVYWGQNQPGMKALLTEISDENKAKAQKIWQDTIDYCKESCRQLAELGLHKQWANRPNDWHIMAKGIVTSTEFENFLELRDHKDAQPEIAELARDIKECLSESTPLILKHSEWHLPYVLDEERKMYGIEALTKISSARCARVSYMTHDGRKPNILEDFKLHDDLVGSVPIHASPTEHQCTPGEPDKFHKNFYGWIQYRSFIEEKISLLPKK